MADARSGLRRSIQQAAVRLIAERGMPNVAMSAVADEAGVSRQTLYNHYPDLESIVIDYARSEIGTAERIIGNVIDAAPDARSALETFVRGNLAGTSDDEVVVTGAGMSPDGEVLVMDMLEPIHQQLRRILQRGVKDGSFRSDLDPESVSEVLFHMIGSGRRLVHMGRDPGTVGELMVSLILKGVDG
jgi:AcrR family transcriptional regulator